MGVIRFKDGSNIELPNDKVRKVGEVLDSYLKSGVDNFIKIQGRRIAISSVREIDENTDSEWKPSDEEVTKMLKQLEAYKVNGILSLEGEYRCLRDLGIIRFEGTGKTTSSFQVVVLDAISFSRTREIMDKAKAFLEWKRKKDEEHLIEIEKTL